MVVVMLAHFSELVMVVHKNLKNSTLDTAEMFIVGVGMQRNACGSQPVFQQAWQ